MLFSLFIMPKLKLEPEVRRRSGGCRGGVAGGGVRGAALCKPGPRLAAPACSVRGRCSRPRLLIPLPCPPSSSRTNHLFTPQEVEELKGDLKKGEERVKSALTGRPRRDD